jgi:hypothetical protein
MDNYHLLSLLLFTVTVFHTTCEPFYDGDKDLSVSRRKRYVVFPRGSTFSVSYRIIQFTKPILALLPYYLLYVVLNLFDFIAYVTGRMMLASLYLLETKLVTTHAT